MTDTFIPPSLRNRFLEVVKHRRTGQTDMLPQPTANVQHLEKGEEDVGTRVVEEPKRRRLEVSSGIMFPKRHTDRDRATTDLQDPEHRTIRGLRSLVPESEEIPQRPQATKSGLCRPYRWYLPMEASPKAKARARRGVKAGLLSPRAKGNERDQRLQPRGCLILMQRGASPRDCASASRRASAMDSAAESGSTRNFLVCPQ